MRTLIGFIALLLASLSNAQQPNPSTAGHDEWWKHAVIYEIYPKSFQDSNGDGLGDINGITSRLDYLQQLGVDAIWITPMYPSPGIDNGYDVSDYTAIAPEFGTMADFDHLIVEAKKRNIRVLMDFVINHTSDQNPWFLESRSSRNNPKRDWYIWRDGGPDGTPPNNWQSWFGHSAWTKDAQTQQFYYHYFYSQQPDLNWRNPEVHQAMGDVLRFWLKRGVAGFRIDAASRLFEDPQFRDDPYLPGHNVYGDRNIQHEYTDNLPEVHDVLKEMRKVVDEYPGNPVLVTEADEPNIVELTKLYGNGDEVQLPMDFRIADVNQLSASRFRKLFAEVESNAARGQPEYFFSNHDQPRQWDRYGDGVHNEAIAKLMAALLLTTRGTPQLYYGEEIGMKTTDPARIEDVKDPIGRLGWPKEKGRDGERTPMQWDSTAEAGFTKSATPWLAVPPAARTYNVQDELKQPDSILDCYRTLLVLRKSQPALRDGAQKSFNFDAQNVLAFERYTTGQKIVVALNMSSKSQTISLGSGRLQIIYSSLFTSSDKARLSHIVLPAFGVIIAEVRP